MKLDKGDLLEFLLGAATYALFLVWILSIAGALMLVAAVNSGWLALGAFLYALIAFSVGMSLLTQEL